MKGKDIAIIILSIVVVIQFIVIMLLIPFKVIEESNKDIKTSQQWDNITTSK